MDLTGAVWRTSRRSASNGGDCVEVAPVWRKASRSSANGGDCVEVAALDREVAVRDSKDRTGPVLAFREPAWVAFVAELKGGRFDR
ncbi:MAG: DUF397 domain-containing protein [Streptosporangiaceae bacterium]